MRWFRSHIRLGSRLALFALAVQLALCFSHIDGCEFGLVSAKAAVSTSTNGPAPSKTAPTNQSDRAPDRGCPICALIQLASTSPPATAPILPPRAAFGHVAPQTPDDIAFAASPHFSFQARAPPAV